MRRECALAYVRNKDPSLKASSGFPSKNRKLRKGPPKPANVKGAIQKVAHRARAVTDLISTYTSVKFSNNSESQEGVRSQTAGTESEVRSTIMVWGLTGI